MTDATRGWLRGGLAMVLMVAAFPVSADFSRLDMELDYTVGMATWYYRAEGEEETASGLAFPLRFSRPVNDALALEVGLFLGTDATVSEDTTQYADRYRVSPTPFPFIQLRVHVTEFDWWRVYFLGTFSRTAMEIEREAGGTSWWETEQSLGYGLGASMGQPRDVHLTIEMAMYGGMSMASINVRQPF